MLICSKVRIIFSDQTSPKGENLVCSKLKQEQKAPSVVSTHAKLSLLLYFYSNSPPFCEAKKKVRLAWQRANELALMREDKVSRCMCTAKKDC